LGSSLGEGEKKILALTTNLLNLAVSGKKKLRNQLCKAWSGFKKPSTFHKYCIFTIHHHYQRKIL
jgi:hypothetical protein